MVSINQSNGTLIYPNPATDKVKVSMESTMKSTQILNTQGLLMIEIKELSTSEYSFDVSDFPAGIYNIRIETNNDWINQKLIKK